MNSRQAQDNRASARRFAHSFVMALSSHSTSSHQLPGSTWDGTDPLIGGQTARPRDRSLAPPTSGGAL